LLVLRRRRSLRRLLVVLGLAFMGLVVAPGAPAAAPLDTVFVTGNTVDGAFASIDIIAPCSSITCATGSGPGFVKYNLAPFYFTVSGSVTCLSVTGPDQGFGTSTAPTTAVMRVTTSIGLDEVTVVDKGANDFQAEPLNATIQAAPVSGPATDCSTPLSGGHQLTDGHAAIFDAPVLPTSKDQCMDGGWQTFGVFKNQGDCVSFVATHGKNRRASGAACA
jgi:hypothetical protein